MPTEETIGLKGGIVERGSLTLCSLGNPYNLAQLLRTGGVNITVSNRIKDAIFLKRA